MERDITALRAEAVFWDSVDFEASDVPAWQPIVYRQLAAEATQYIVDWQLDGQDGGVEAA